MPCALDLELILFARVQRVQGMALLSHPPCMSANGCMKGKAARIQPQRQEISWHVYFTDA